MQFTIRIDEKLPSGLSGIPDHLAALILKSFSKNEIIEDPEKVITAFIEGEIMKYGNSVFQDKKNFKSVANPDFNLSP